MTESHSHLNTPIARPNWIRVRRLDDDTRDEIQQALRGIATVCAEANCPNIGECWSRGTATFMIMGDKCTRNCRFCDVATGRPGALNPHEPQVLAESVADLGLKYAVITCVDRDDLPDFGAAHWATCIRAVRERNPGVKIETLIGDMRGKLEDIATVHLLRECDVDLLTLSQYLKPRNVKRKWEVQRYLHPDEFLELADYALELGFKGVMSSPLTRSSYRAETLYEKAIATQPAPKLQ